MKRREFISLLGGAAAAWPLAAHAQQPGKVRRIGMLMGSLESDSEGQRWVKTFIQALQELGWRSGANVQIDLRWASDLDHMRVSAKELIELQPDLIQVTTTLATSEVLRQTRTIPVVFSMVSDPIGSGIVQSLPHPGGNATGFINIESSLGGKWLEIIKEIAPRITRVVMLFNPTTAPQMAYYKGPLEAAAMSFGIQAEWVPIHEISEIEATIAALEQDQQAGLIVPPDYFTVIHRDLISSLAARHRVITVYPFGVFVRAGGLVSYGVDLLDLQRRAASYADRILKGASPTDLPTQLPTKFELVINLKTAKTLGLTVPPALLSRADEVIE